MSDVKDRIELLIRNQHVNQQTFASMLGVSPASLSSVLTGRTKITLNIVNALKTKFSSLNLDWLLYGNDPMFLPVAGSGEDNSTLPQTENPSAISPAVVSPMAEDSSHPHSNASSTGKFGQGVDSTLINNIGKIAKNIDKQKRVIVEIRVFYDDQTWESFVPKK